MKKYVLDSCALIALMNKEAGAHYVAALYKEAMDGKAELIINKINLLEIYYGYLKEDGEEFAELLLTNIQNSIVKINEIISDEILRQAGKIKSNVKKISLADCFAVAQSIISDAVLVTADHHELDVVDNNNIAKLLWIR